MVFKGRTAVITGALGGIGHATAEYFLQKGISGIAILDIVKCDEKVKSLQNNYKNSKVIFLLVDVGDVGWVERVFQQILDEFKQIDILVNSVGVLDEIDIEKCLKVNLLGVINTCQIAVKLMSKQTGIIANISSMLGVKVKPGLPVYCAAKHGVIAFTNTMADKFYFEKYGVKFINICPGKTHTPMIDQLCETLQKIGQSKSLDDLVDHERPIQSADECAKCIIEIIASGENGSTWSINGGKMKRILCDERV